MVGRSILEVKSLGLNPPLSTFFPQLWKPRAVVPRGSSLAYCRASFVPFLYGFSYGWLLSFRFFCKGFDTTSFLPFFSGLQFFLGYFCWDTIFSPHTFFQGCVLPCKRNYAYPLWGRRNQIFHVFFLSSWAIYRNATFGEGNEYWQIYRTAAHGTQHTRHTAVAQQL